MAKLYRILTPLKFPHNPSENRKRDESVVAHMLAENDEEVYNYIEHRFYAGNKFQGPGWCAFSESLSRQEILKKKGDYTVKKPIPPQTLIYHDEVYNIGFRWEDLGDISVEETTTLQRLGILPK